jgi:hypothetical protein
VSTTSSTGARTDSRPPQSGLRHDRLDRLEDVPVCGAGVRTYPT